MRFGQAPGNVAAEAAAPGQQEMDYRSSYRESSLQLDSMLAFGPVARGATVGGPSGIPELGEVAADEPPRPAWLYQLPGERIYNPWSAQAVQAEEEQKRRGAWIPLEEPDPYPLSEGDRAIAAAAAVG